MTMLALFTVFFPLVLAPYTQHCYALAEPYKHWPMVVEKATQLETPCYHNWYAGGSPLMEDERYTPSVHDLTANNPGFRYIAAWAEAQPGRTWLMLNEPELQGVDAAQAARDMYYWQEAIGDNGRIACCGTQQVLGTRGVDWLDTYLLADGVAPDAWHIHIYAANVDDWRKQLSDFDKWNEQHGNLPVIVSEAGGGPDVFAYVMALQDAKVEAVYWFLAGG